MNGFAISHKIIFLIFNLNILLFSNAFPDSLNVKVLQNPNDIKEIAEFDVNNIWTTSKCGITHWDLQSGETTHYTKRNSLLERDYAAEVVSNGNEIWITSGRQLIRILNGYWEVFTANDLGIGNISFFDKLEYDSFGRIWVTWREEDYYADGISFLKNGVWNSFNRFNSPIQNTIHFLKAGFNGEILITLDWTLPNKFYKHSDASGWQPMMPHNFSAADIVFEPDSTIWFIGSQRVGFISGDSTIIVNTSSGVWPHWRDKYFRSMWSEPNGLGFNNTSKVYHKPTGTNILNVVSTIPNSYPISYLYNGRMASSGNIYFLGISDFQGVGFIVLSNGAWGWKKTDYPFQYNSVRSLFLKRDNQVIFGRGLTHHYDGNSVYILTQPLNKPKYLPNETLAYIKDDKIFTDAGGYIFNPSSLNWLSTFDIDSKGNIYAAGNGGLVYKNTNGKIGQMSDCPIFYITSMAIDQKDFIWVADPNYDGFAMFDGYEWDHYEIHDPRVAQSNIDLFYVDSYARVWCITNQTLPNYGLSMFDGEKWNIFNSINGLPTPFIYDMTEDAFGNLWMATRLGLLKYNQNAFEIYDHTNSDIGTPWTNAIEFDYSGNTWVGTESGLNILNENGLVFNKPLQSCQLTNFLATNSSDLALLKWECSDATSKLVGFHVEKSRTNYKFTRIATVNFANNLYNYSFVDSTTHFGTQHYRILEFYLDGSKRISPSVSTELPDSVGLVIKELKEEATHIVLRWSVFNSESLRFFAIFNKTENGDWRFLTKVPTTNNTNYELTMHKDTLRTDAFKLHVVANDGFVKETDEFDLYTNPPPHGIPDNYALSHVYPNPTNSQINIEIELPRKTMVITNIFNVLGEKVFGKEYGIMQEGYHTLKIELSNIPSGIYFLEVQMESKYIRKFTLVR